MSGNYTHYTQAFTMSDTRKPRPGSLPVPNYDATPDPVPKKPQAIPPWHGGDPDVFRAELQRREMESTYTELRKARAKSEELIGAVRSAAFDDWIRRCVKEAKLPNEWTQARTLYESYINHARHFGDNRSQQKQSVLALATETQWGRMMATMFVKKRRSTGWHYPLRCRRIK